MCLESAVEVQNPNEMDNASFCFLLRVCFCVLHKFSQKFWWNASSPSHPSSKTPGIRSCGILTIQGKVPTSLCTNGDLECFHSPVMPRLVKLEASRNPVWRKNRIFAFQNERWFWFSPSGKNKIQKKHKIKWNWPERVQWGRRSSLSFSAPPVNL